jgi:GntR family transcriptional regulator
MSIRDHKINKSVPIPFYYQLKTIILEEMANGNYLPGDLIPTEKEISEFFLLSRTTVRQAITELVQEGKLYRIKSKGTYIAKPKILQDFIKKVETYNDQIKRLGMVPSTKLLELKVIVPTQTVTDVLKLKGDQQCISILRKRFADNEPNVVVRTYLPYDACSFIMDHDLESEEDARMLDIDVGQPIHFFTSIGFNTANEPIEYSLARYRGDRNRFEVDLYYQPE